MSLFAKSASDPKSTQTSMLGPSYSYSDNIRSPSQLGMSDKGDLATLGKDISGLLGYVSLLVDGSGPVSVPGGPLGNKYFMKTGAKCTDVATNTSQDRYIYINNVPPPDTIPGPGLIPGTVIGLEVLNPFAIMGAFMAGSDPPCMPITMEVKPDPTGSSPETHYVTLVDINGMDATTFPGGKKPAIPAAPANTKTKSTSESFANYHDSNDSSVNLPDDVIIQLYFACLAGVGLYILYKIGQK